MQGTVERALLHEVSPLCYHLLSLQHCSKRLRGREGGREEGREGGREGGKGGREGGEGREGREGGRETCSTLCIFTGCSNLCLSCGHGGHTHHLMDWFASHSTCPSGCGCRCLETSGWSE